MYSPCARVTPAYILPVACAHQRCSVRVNNDERERERERKRVIFFFFLRFHEDSSLRAKLSNPPSDSIFLQRKLDVRNDVRSKSRHRHRPSVTSASSNLLFFHIVCSRGHKSWRSGWNILTGRSGLSFNVSRSLSRSCIDRIGGGGGGGGGTRRKVDERSRGDRSRGCRETERFDRALNVLLQLFKFSEEENCGKGE